MMLNKRNYWHAGRIAFFTGQLARLLDQGISLTSSLRLIGQQNIIDISMTKLIIQHIESGVSFSRALEAVKLPLVCLSFIRAAEEHGDYVYGLEKCQEYFAAREDWSIKIKQACFYPCIVMLVVIVSFLFLMIFILPRFVELYLGMGIELPWITRVFIDLYYGFIHKGFIIVICACLCLIFLWQRFRKNWLAYVTKIRLLRLWLGDYTSYFISLQLGCLLQAGVPILRALQLMIESSPKHYLNQYLCAVKDAMMSGQSFAQSLSGQPLSVALENLIQMATIGEESGRLPQTLTTLANSTSFLMRTKIELMIRLLEPLLIMTIGISIAVIVIILFLPMLKLVETL